MANGNNKAVNVLTALATSGDTWVKLGTLLLVAISGLGNFVATEQSGSSTRGQLEKEIHEIYAALDRNRDTFRQIAQDAANNRAALAKEAQDTMRKLANQGQILSNEDKIIKMLEEIRRWQQDFKNPESPHYPNYSP